MRAILAIALGGLLAGCVTMYGPQSVSGGYSEVMRGDDVYLVRFQGNGFTHRDQVEDMALLRAAELTLEKGNRYFTILSEESRVDHSRYVTAAQSRTTGSIDSFGNFRATTQTFGGQPIDISKPNARLLIGMAKDNGMAGYSWIDASKVIAELAPKYKKP